MMTATQLRRVLATGKKRTVNGSLGMYRLQAPGAGGGALTPLFRAAAATDLREESSVLYRYFIIRGCNLPLPWFLSFT